MSRGLVRVLPWALVALAVALMITSDTFSVTTGTSQGFGEDIFIWAIAVVFGVAGALIAARLPQNPIGWLFLVASVSAGLGNMSGAYAQYYEATRHGPALLGETAAKYGDLSWMPFILVPATFLLALFPDGHVVSRRWRPVAWCAAVGIAGAFVVEALVPGTISDYPTIENPYGVDSPWISPLNGLSLLLTFIGITGSAASLVVRFRRSHGEQRQQIKWLALAGSVAAFTTVLGTVFYEVLGEALANSLIMTSIMGLPVATVLAILRYRLYDIDVVINRTLVYGSLTALLAGTYLVSVLLLQLVLRDITSGSGLAVAASTLAASALVRPARARIQEQVDRRFFRRKYDAAQTLAGFGTRLRERVDLDDIGADLLSVVGSTVQPAHASLWLRSSGGLS